jgi:hypothetical protein
MTPRAITLAKALTYAGTLPLLAGVALQYAPIAGVDGQAMALRYAAIIVSFLCGIHWAVELFFAARTPRHLLLTSNATALLAWCSLLLPSLLLAFLLQAWCFLYLLTLDLKLRDAGILPAWFYGLRRNATIIVVVCLAWLMRGM